jgi:lipoate-protein ligase A
MIFIPRESFDPYVNLATEEYVFKNFIEEVIMFWINDPSIIIGKHQNPMAEINLDFALQHNLPVIRRISGGGTVYHDRGNLNYTLIRSGVKGQLIDYAKHTRPIIDALKELSIEAKLEGKSNLTIKGLKFSGNSEHVFKNRILHHGTMLFDSELDELYASLKLAHHDYHDKAVRSIRSNVTNIHDHLSGPMTIIEFRDFLLNHFTENNPGLEIRELNPEEQAAINALANHKYRSWEWNFGYSPRYVLDRKILLGKKKIHLYLEIIQGKINELHLKNEHGYQEFPDLQEHLKGLPHEKNAIGHTLNRINFASSYKEINTEELIKQLF